MKRYYIVFSGRVQGVGFRYTVTNMAKNLHLTGWIRNMTNGNVEMEIQGEQAVIDLLLNHLLTKSRWIVIEDYSIKELNTKAESAFEIVY